MTIDDASLEQTKQANVGQLLIRCARLWNEEGLARARTAMDRPIRAAHLALFAHIDLAGTRLTEISRRADLSKQAIHPLISELERWKLLERIEDPNDGRAKIIRFTQEGREAMLRGLTILSSIEQEIAQSMSPERVQLLGSLLRDLLQTLEQDIDRSR